ncbi:hypothetical protein BJP34_27480 [Moorena producens PAL-8-15-08-1]|uniref:Uncharacterized protein n=1 Tax=Moorena producens PAL-8-15-08-1 TaxID=1458985 RepID=A0A1D8TYP3_9CYAN|nr:hypothetical protein BJP34_27480 [Moorena producens PAL-8-15-08-1]
MSISFRINPDVILPDQIGGGFPPRNLAMQRGLGEPVRSWGFPPETKPDYVEPLWLVGYAEKG